MNAIAILSELAGRPVQALEWFWDDLDPTKLNVHPGGHDNSPAWLLWHAGREIDVQLAHLSGEEQTWTVSGWGARFAMDLDPDDLGYGHSAAQARAIALPGTDTSKQLLRDYLEAVTAQAQAYISTLSDDDLDDVIDDAWDPPVTRGVRLVSLFDDALQHVGQAAYSTGMRA